MRARCWAGAALGVYALVIVVILVLPVSYSGIVDAIGEGLRTAFGLTGFGTGWIEFFANILLFAPLGLLLALLFRRSWVGVLIAIGLSVAAEALQIVIPSRQPSLRDILANAIGALIGATVAWVLSRRRSPHPLDEAPAQPHGVAQARASVQDPEN